MGYLKAILKILLISILLLVTALLSYTYFYGEEIKSYLINEINEQLLVEAEVSGVDISLLQDFPNLSLILEDLHLHQGERSLVKAKEARAKFSLADLLDKKFELHAVAIREGEVFLTEDQNGVYFPKIWKAESEEGEKTPFQLKLQKVSLYQVQLHYKEIDASSAFDLTVESAWAKGNFGANNYKLAWDSKVSGFTFYKGGTPTINNESFALEAHCLIKNDEKMLDVDNMIISWNKLEATADGTLNYADKVVIDLEFREVQNSLKELSILLPEKRKLQIDSLNAKGNVRLNGKMQGELGPKFKPSLSLNYQLSKGSYTNEKNNIKVTDIEFKGSFYSKDLSKEKGGRTKIDTLTANLNGFNLQGNVAFDQADNAVFEADGKLTGDLDQVNQWLSNSTYQFTSGSLESEFEFEIPMQLIRNSNVKGWKSGDNSTYIRLKDAALSKDGKELISDLTVKAALGKNDLYAEELNMNYRDLELAFQGQILNLIGFIEDSTEILYIDGKLNSPEIDLYQTLNWAAEGSSNSNRAFRFYLDCAVDQMNYKDLHMQDLNFHLRNNENGIEAKDIELSGLGGSAKGDLSVIKKSDGNHIESRAEFSSIDIHELFVAFKDFGQSEIKAENIYGKASGFMDSKLIILDSGEIVSESITLNSYLKINEGKLVNYETIYELSDFIELDELKEITFKELENQVKIENEMIYIPRFSIRSSALDLELEGTHSFENEIDYHVSLLLDQLLGKKAKKPKESEFGYIADDGLGRTQLFLRMSGNVSDPKIRYDRSQLKSHWQQEAKKEKETLKSILKEEFGLFKKDSTVKTPTKQQTEGVVFEIEWDEGEEDKTEESSSNEPQKSQAEPAEGEKKSKKKGKFGKFIDKIAKPNEEEYVYPQ